MSCCDDITVYLAAWITLCHAVWITLSFANTHIVVNLCQRFATMCVFDLYPVLFSVYSFYSVCVCCICVCVYCLGVSHCQYIHPAYGSHISMGDSLCTSPVIHCVVDYILSQFLHHYDHLHLYDVSYSFSPSGNSHHVRPHHDRLLNDAHTLTYPP